MRMVGPRRRRVTLVRGSSRALRTRTALKAGNQRALVDGATLCGTRDADAAAPLPPPSLLPPEPPAAPLRRRCRLLAWLAHRRTAGSRRSACVFIRRTRSRLALAAARRCPRGGAVIWVRSRALCGRFGTRHMDGCEALARAAGPVLHALVLHRLALRSFVLDGGLLPAARLLFERDSLLGRRPSRHACVLDGAVLVASGRVACGAPRGHGTPHLTVARWIVDAVLTHRRLPKVDASLRVDRHARLVREELRGAAAREGTHDGKACICGAWRGAVAPLARQQPPGQGAARSIRSASCSTSVLASQAQVLRPLPVPAQVRALVHALARAPGPEREMLLGGVRFDGVNACVVCCDPGGAVAVALLSALVTVAGSVLVELATTVNMESAVVLPLRTS